MKRWLFITAKLLLAGGLIAYLLHTGDIDPRRLSEIENWAWVALAQVLVLGILLFTSLRWYLIGGDVPGESGQGPRSWWIVVFFGRPRNRLAVDPVIDHPKRSLRKPRQQVRFEIVDISAVLRDAVPEKNDRFSSFEKEPVLRGDAGHESRVENDEKNCSVRFHGRCVPLNEIQ